MYAFNSSLSIHDGITLPCPQVDRLHKSLCRLFAAHTLGAFGWLPVSEPGLHCGQALLLDCKDGLIDSSGNCEHVRAMVRVTNANLH